jgi:hypothetical protein
MACAPAFQLNGCGATVMEWNEDKVHRSSALPCALSVVSSVALCTGQGRFVVRLDGSHANMLLRAANLERDRREAWSPAMHDPTTTAQIANAMAEYAAESMKNANPFAAAGISDDMFNKQQDDDEAED